MPYIHAFKHDGENLRNNNLLIKNIMEQEEKIKALRWIDQGDCWVYNRE